MPGLPGIAIKQQDFYEVPCEVTDVRLNPGVEVPWFLPGSIMLALCTVALELKP